MVSGNQAGLDSSAGRGGGIGVREAESVNITDSIFFGNETVDTLGGKGGGLYLYFGSSLSNPQDATITRSVFRQNKSLGEANETGGGGIYANLEGDRAAGSSIPTLEIVDSTISGNEAREDGGGLWVCTKYGAVFEMRGSTVSGNQTGRIEGTGGYGDPLVFTGDGGGVWIGMLGDRPEVYLDSSIANVTVSGNSAISRGGGMWAGIVPSGPEGDFDLALDHTTITDNRSPNGGGLYSDPDATLLRIDTLLSNTIVSANQVSDTNAAPNNIAGAINQTSDYNLWGTSTAVLPSLNNIINDNPGLTPLQDNNGFTLPDGSTILTHEPLADSPAINNGDPAVLFDPNDFDQRGAGFERVIGNRVDIGAVEFQPDDGGPKVIDIRIDGSGWGRDAYSFAAIVPAGEQLRPIFTQGADTIEIQFDQNVVLAGSGSELTLKTDNGVALPGVTYVGFDPILNVATWTVAGGLPDGKYAIHLDNTITNGAGTLLDADWVNPDNNTPDYYPDDIYDPEYVSSFTPGDGMPGASGGGFRFHFALLAGDYDGDGLVEGEATGDDFLQAFGPDPNPNADGDGDGNGGLFSDALVAVSNNGAKLSLKAFGDADFNDDEVVDDLDLALWEITVGETMFEEAERGDGDADGDGKVDSLDLAYWEAQFGATPPTDGSPSADFDDDMDVDNADLLIWQTGFGKGTGNADNDSDVGIADLLIWNSSFGRESAWYVSTASVIATVTAGDFAPWLDDVVISGSISIHNPYSFDAVVDGSGDQLITVPVGGADTIAITFSEPVNVSAGSLSVVGLTQSFVPLVAQFDYNPGTHTATWRLENWNIHGDQYLLSLTDAVTDADGNRLDGEWTNPQSVNTTAGSASNFPSGDGDPGGRFDFLMTLLPGDADLDNDVDMDDWDIFDANMGITNGTFTTADFSGDGIVSLFGDGFVIVAYMDWNLQNATLSADLDGDGDVDGDDLETVLDNLGMTNPTAADGDLDGDGDIDIEDLDHAFRLFGIELDLVA
ncbi:MAG: Ig-like domain-containing protein [Planctomycetota bacterium]